MNSKYILHQDTPTAGLALSATTNEVRWCSVFLEAQLGIRHQFYLFCREAKGLGLMISWFRFCGGSVLSCSAVIADFLMLQNYPQNANISISQDPERQTAALSDPRPSCSCSRPLVRFLLKIIY